MNNYHTHTYRCTHAVGDEETIVKRAIACGYQELGFSEHVPLPHLRWHLIKALLFSVNNFWSSLSWFKTFMFNGPGMRMPYREKNDHLKKIDEVKEIYKNQIKVYKGFECEYLEDYLTYYRKLLDNKEVDYLIFGHHYHKFATGRHYYGKPNIHIKEIQNYVIEAKKALQTGLFTYFAHPDLFMAGYRQWNDEVERLVYELCMSAKEHNIPLELNAGGIRRKQIEINGVQCYEYPNYFFWKIASEIGCEAIIGMDAHNPDHLNSEDYRKLETFAQDLNLKLITTLK